MDFCYYEIPNFPRLSLVLSRLFVRQIMVSLSLKGTLITTSFLKIISSNDFYSILIMKSVVSASLNDSKLFPVCGSVP